MGGRFWKVVRCFVVLLLMPLICSCSVEALSFLASGLDWRAVDWFLLGFMGCFLAYGVVRYTGGVLYSHFHFIRILRHELTHAVVAMAEGREVKEMLVVNPAARVASSQPHVTYGPGCLTTLAALSPYYLPLFTLPFLVIRFLVLPWVRDGVDFLIGFTLAFHYISLTEELAIWQSDIRKTGVFTSYILIGFFNLAFLVLIKAVLHNDWSAVGRLEDVWRRAWEWYRLVWEWLMGLAQRAF